jgi:hypothetical protein
MKAGATATATATATSTAKDETVQTVQRSHVPRRRRRRGTILSWVVFVWTLLSWGLLWIVDKSCDFVYLTGQYVDGDGGTTSIPEEYFIHRGTQRGMYNPNDSCQSWGVVAATTTLTLDPYMVAVRVSSALSIVIGFFIWVYILLVSLRLSGCIITTVTVDNHDNTNTVARRGRCSCLMTCVQRLTNNKCVMFVMAFLAFCVAVFQALTHLMVHSTLCEESVEQSTIEVVLVNGRTAIYDTCLHDTVSYNITFVTMFAWVLSAILIASGFITLPNSEGSQTEEESTDDIHRTIKHVIDIDPRARTETENDDKNIVATSTTSKHEDGDENV